MGTFKHKFKRGYKAHIHAVTSDGRVLVSFEYPVEGGKTQLNPYSVVSVEYMVNNYG